MHNVRQQNRPPVPPGDLGPKQDHWREVEEEGGAGGGGGGEAGDRGEEDALSMRRRLRLRLQTLAGIGIARFGARSKSRPRLVVRSARGRR